MENNTELNKLKESLAKTNSTFQKDITRLRKTCIKLNISNTLRKHQITQFNLFIKKLLKENRITKEEVSQYMEKRKNIK